MLQPLLINSRKVETFYTWNGSNTTLSWSILFKQLWTEFALQKYKWSKKMRSSKIVRRSLSKHAIFHLVSRINFNFHCAVQVLTFPSTITRFSALVKEKTTLPESSFSQTASYVCNSRISILHNKFFPLSSGWDLVEISSKAVKRFTWIVHPSCTAFHC